ncbi:MAG: hypothetical protein H6819_03285 [Phycisphaerales bacterium]|nr:hypothetical protein [Phycisphaerales bacterium]MCB9856219.1 hypothetical protein [Phycisphaerales bacterium]MCB9863342.1 hypothetical protein [Phycisphaerales bacterium]
MLLQCPNCRERVSFYRAFATPAWGSFTCKSCGSTLTISFGRRIIAAAVWAATFIFASEWFGLYRWGRLIAYPLMALSLVAVLYLFEKIILIDRRAFTCLQCGYDLKGLPENRCPECGTPFDASEIEKIRARIGLRRPKPRNRWIAVIVVILLAFSVAAGFVVWQNSAKRMTTTATTTSAPTP